LLFWIGSSFVGWGQMTTLLEPNNTFVQNKADEIDPFCLIWWKCDSLLPKTLFTIYKSHTGLGINDSMAIEKEWFDPEICLSHVKYQHYFKGIEVEYSEVREHIDPLLNYVILTQGRYVEGLNLSSTPGIPENIALDLAKAHIGADTFAWECDSMELWLKQDSIFNLDTTWFPEGSLLYAYVRDTLCDTCYVLTDTSYRLAWVFDIYAKVPYSYSTIYVDAMTGDILREISSEHSFGNIDHMYYGRQQMDDAWYGGFYNRWILEANDDGRNIRTQFFDSRPNVSNAESWKRTDLPFIPSSSNGEWGSTHQRATSAHFVVQKSWEMFQNVFNRTGPDDNSKFIGVVANSNAEVTSVTHINANGPKHKWGFNINFSINNGYQVTYDIAGHEFGHIVSEYTARLVHENEPGALEESFCDIYGLLTERYAKGGVYNWTLSEDAGVIVRNMDNPNLDWNSQMNKFSPSYWYQPGHWWVGMHINSGGIHHNVGAHNRYFNLLAIGGNQLGINVNGVGISKAGTISHYAFTNLMGRLDGYRQAREKALAAARLMYGKNSFEQNEVCKAYAAINIGTCQEEEEDEDPCIRKYMCSIGGTPGEFRTNDVKNIQTKVNKIVIYPNPTFDEINFSFGDLTINEINTSNFHFKLYNAIGELVEQTSLDYENLLNTFSLKRYPSGLYFIQLESNNQTIRTFKIIKL
jgi:Zn-dependent metalloprotease